MNARGPAEFTKGRIERVRLVVSAVERYTESTNNFGFDFPGLGTFYPGDPGISIEPIADAYFAAAEADLAGSRRWLKPEAFLQQ